MAEQTAEFYIQKLNMLPHPEGGWYKETYRSENSVSTSSLPEMFEGDRSFSTAIYFLLTSENFSGFHRIKSDEMWHFYDGDGLVIHELTKDGEYIKHQLGLDLEDGEEPQLVINARSWFASEVKLKRSFALVGCTVAPGFDFQDFELASATELAKGYPHHSKLINRLCIR